MKLERWDRKEFVDFCGGYGVIDPDKVYDEVSSRIGTRHPLLTRAVFVKKLADIVKSADREDFLSQVRPETEDYFSPFIDRILQREINDKWINKHGEPPQPLLSLSEHHELLGLLAEEMWLSKTGSVSSQMCSSLAELFCESRSLDPTVTRQVRERFQNHALLVSTDPLHSQIAFDHEHFREFFLGEQIGAYLATGARADLRKILGVDLIPNWALDTAITVASRKETKVGKLIQVVVDMAKSDTPVSFARENSGALCVRLLDKREHEYAVIESVSFPADFILGRDLAHIEFRKCYFRPSALDDSQLSDVGFVECEFERLDLPDSYRFAGVEMIRSVVHALTLRKGESTSNFYDPARVEGYLQSFGVSIPGHEAVPIEIPEITPTDPELYIIEKLLRVFMRSTVVSEYVLNLRLGDHAGWFFSELKAPLISSGVLQTVKNRGGGLGERYRLGIPMQVASEALASANGSYSCFLEQVNVRKG
jgi:hypothetical protein